MAPPLSPPAPGDAFLARLAAEPPPVTRSLPAALEPLAAMVAGTTDVRLATGPAVQRALGDVGRQAATVGNTIHLAHTPTADRAADVAVVSHELVHVGAPSARPRFHGGPRDAEERRAEAVARTVAESARRGTGGLPVGGASLAGRAVDRIVQRAVDDALRRLPPPAPVEPPAPPPAAVPQVVQLAPERPPAAPPVVQRAPAIQRDVTTAPAQGDGLDLDKIIEALEERVLTELERRGGRLVEVI